MLIPRFSIRWLLGLTTFSAGVSMVLSYAVRGHAWAIGVTSALWTLVIVSLLFASAFLCAWWINELIEARRRKLGQSPFASQKPETPFAPHQGAAESPPPITG